jgi:hypothetical protein
MKGNTMKKLLTILASSLFSTAAFAADLPVKAPAYVAPICAAGNCSGWYADFGIMGDGSNADIIGGGLNNSVFQSGGALLIGGGYQLWNAAWFAAIEANIGYEFSQNNGLLINQGSSRFVGQELIKLGYNFFPSSQTASTVPGQSAVPIVSPANFLAATTPYLAFGGMQRRGISEWVNGAGVETVISAGWSSAVEYLYAPSQQGMPATQVVSLKLQKHF